jgi:hypothetical protein
MALSRNSIRLAALTCTGLLALAVPAASANAASTPASTQPTLVNSTFSNGAIPVGANVVTWGKEANGKRFSRTYVEGSAQQKALASTVVPNVIATCTLYISDIDGGKGTSFVWETSQTCSGPFGEQKQQTQIWRTSYRGWLGYGGIATTGLVMSQTASYDWEQDCNNGDGTYNYEAELKGYATDIGWSVWVGSGNQPRDNCGPYPPA